jgi:hypothetical protein
MQNLLDTLKSKKFWGGVFTALGGVLAGTLALPDAVIQLLQLIGG